MSLRENILFAYRFNLRYAKMAMEDVTEEQMTQQPKPGMNHAAWILGHLALERVFFKSILSLDLPTPEGWEALFMPGSTPVAERTKYPSKAQLLAELEASHAAVEAAFMKVSEADLAKETPNERARKFFPTMGDLLVGLMTSHAGMHIGQLSAWRRAMGLKSVF